jgi:hypothetical protein
LKTSSNMRIGRLAASRAKRSPARSIGRNGRSPEDEALSGELERAVPLPSRWLMIPRVSGRTSDRQVFGTLRLSRSGRREYHRLPIVELRWGQPASGIQNGLVDECAYGERPKAHTNVHAPLESSRAEWTTQGPTRSLCAFRDGLGRVKREMWR